MDLVYKSGYRLRLYVSDFMIQGKENKDIKNVVLFNNVKYI